MNRIFAAAGWISAAALATFPIVPAARAAAAPEARTTSGWVSGAAQGGAVAYLGIPYAAPPVGPNRWRAPQPAPTWSGVRRADHFGASCEQPSTPQGFGPWTHEYVVQGQISEDCLYLNVWTTTAARRSPVLVWVYGGGFNQGSGSVAVYDGAHLATRGVVVVNFNYRVGALGFLALPALTHEAAGAGETPANYGLQDMVAALKWVRANIAAFGGDPDQVTLAGQSAGAMAVHDLIASPMARGLFQRAIAESGLPDAARTVSLSEAEQAGEAFARSKGAQSLAELRALPASALNGEPPAGQARFGPVRDGTLLPASPEALQAAARADAVPMLVGLTADEGSAFSPDYGKGDAASFHDLLVTAYGSEAGAVAGLYPARSDADRVGQSRAALRDRWLANLDAWASRRAGPDTPPTYAYLFDYQEPGPQSARYHAFHSSELPYLFDTLDAAPERGFTAADMRMSAIVSQYWLDFVRTGDPNGAGLPPWPRLRPEAPMLLQLDLRPHARPLLEASRLQVIRQALARVPGAPDERSSRGR